MDARALRRPSTRYLGAKFPDYCHGQVTDQDSPRLIPGLEKLRVDGGGETLKFDCLKVPIFVGRHVTDHFRPPIRLRALFRRFSCASTWESLSGGTE